METTAPIFCMSFDAFLSYFSFCASFLPRDTSSFVGILIYLVFAKNDAGFEFDSALSFFKEREQPATVLVKEAEQQQPATLMSARK